MGVIILLSRASIATKSVPGFREFIISQLQSCQLFHFSLIRNKFPKIKGIGKDIICLFMSTLYPLQVQATGST